MLAHDLTPTARSELRRHKPSKEPTTAERMAELFVSNARRGYETTREDLFLEGFTDSDITRDFVEARRIARGELQARALDDTEADYDQRARIERGANLVIGMLQEHGTAWVQLRNSGFATPELKRLHGPILDRAAQIMIESQPLPSGSHQ